MKVQGRCPVCGHYSLFLGSGGYVTCSISDCPNPSAASDILFDHASPDHVVHLAQYDYWVQHPLRERLNGELAACPLDQYLRTLGGPPRIQGRYVVRDVAAAGEPHSWHWTLTGDPS